MTTGDEGGSADAALAGADPADVERALATGDPLPGASGFAGALPDGRLVRDVLGRQPLFYDAEAGGECEGEDEGAVRETVAWSHDHRDLDSPRSFPAGHVGRTDPARAWTLPAGTPADADRAVADLRSALERTLGALEGDGLAVAFSGGVDSAVVASAVDAPLYVASFPDGPDLAAARESAAAMGRTGDLRSVTLDLEALEDAVPAVARATGRTNAMDVAIALPLVLAARRAAADGYDRIAVGQGADELFGGYEKVARADERVAADTVLGARDEVLGSLPAQLERDVLALRDAGVEPVAPLLHDRVVRAALALPGEALASGDERKVGFRRAARALVPDAVAGRPKQAVQYGSRVSRELDRLARQAGFKRRMDDHVSRYVASRVA